MQVTFFGAVSVVAGTDINGPGDVAAGMPMTAHAYPADGALVNAVAHNGMGALLLAMTLWLTFRSALRPAALSQTP